jgi:effector-binding domain-containing protein
MKKFLITILVIFIVAVLTAVIWLATLDGKYEIKRSITIQKSAEEVFALIQDFNQWPHWSPWLSMEPDAKVNISGDGKSVNESYSWEGELVGVGTITHIDIKPLEYIEQEIVFKKPLDSQSLVYWEFAIVNDSTTTIKWGMKGEMPFFLRFMTRMMEPIIGMDYDRGLRMIKDIAEKGYVASNVEIIGVVDAPAIKYIGERIACSMEDVGTSMGDAFYRIRELADTNEVKYDMAISVYHHFDFIKGDCDYTAAIPIKDDINWGEPYYIGHIPSSKALKIKFTGDYEHIGNAWSAAMSYNRLHKLRENKGVAPYEVYLTNPMDEPDERKWVSEVYVPVK